MNAKTVMSAIVSAIVLLMSGLIIWVPLVPLAPTMKEAAASLASADDVDWAGQVSSTQRQPLTAGGATSDTALMARVARLERLVAELDLATAVKDLRQRVEELERSSTPSQRLDLSQLKRETSSLKIAYDHLANRMGMMPAGPTGLQQRVFALEASVRRLESHR